MRSGPLLLLGLALLATWPARAQCPAQPQTTVTTVPEVRRGHEVRFAPRLAEIEAALGGTPRDMILLGDSIVQQWPAERLEAAFPGRRVLNAGVSGDGAAALLFRLSGQRTEAVVQGQRAEIGVQGWQRQSPRDVVLLLGTNDLGRAPSCDVAQGVLAVVARLRQLWPAARVNVISILPRGEDQADMAPAIASANAELAARAAGAGFRFIDANAALRCQGGCGLTRPPNHVHLTAAGYARLERAVAGALR